MISFDSWRCFIFELILFTFTVRWNESLKGYEADSWGTEFIFIIPQKSSESNQAACYIHAMDREKNVTANIEYNILSIKNNKSEIEKKKDKVVLRSFYQYNFHNLVVNNAVDGLHMLEDNRIHITSLDKISIIAYVSDDKSAIDYFLVHPVGMGGNYYGFSLPGRSTITLYFIPLGATNKTISQNHGVHNVSIKLRQNNKIKTVKQSMKAGSLWQYTTFVQETISIWIHDQLNSTISVTKRVRSKVRTKLNDETARLLIIALVWNVSLLGVKKTDFGCFMPTPMIVDQCAELTTPAYYPINSAFVSNALFTSPSDLCPKEMINIRTTMTESNLLTMEWNKSAEKISLKEKVSKKMFAITSGTTIMNIVHYGGNEGMFIHEIPAYSQWVNGDSPVVVPEGSEATLYVLADDYGREATMEGFEYPYFEAMDDVSPDFSLFLYTRKLNPGIYRVGIDQELGGRYIAILVAEFSEATIGYVAAINLHKIPPPIFVKYSTTAHLTTTNSPTTPLLVSTMTTVTTTRGASLNVLSNNLFAICFCLIAYVERKQ
ncbi:Uncharacterized protein BM_BM9011 [Brugia malayi]|uniref:Bm9011 n=1 Tax=Brugia malayi TaxID=6279 RepID=A0A4E9FA52_BRUMA|nr:Uncharacterized protein BM_BM9011 [Brugia malayi]VIO93038.1 Uncharacterized protein BM_BM9011 [Brugia malayi]